MNGCDAILVVVVVVINEFKYIEWFLINRWVDRRLNEAFNCSNERELIVNLVFFPICRV